MNIIDIVFLTFRAGLSIPAYLRSRRNTGGLPYPPGSTSRFLLGDAFDCISPKTVASCICHGPNTTSVSSLTHHIAALPSFSRLSMPTCFRNIDKRILPLHVPRQSATIINSAKVLKNLLDTRSALNSDRRRIGRLTLYVFRPLSRCFQIM